MASTTLAAGTIVKVSFGSDVDYVAKVQGFQEGHIGLYQLEWLESVPRYMTKGSIDLIEQDRVSTF